MTPPSKRVPPHARAAVTILCGVCLVAGAGPAKAGVNVWTSKGPPGGEVVALAIDPTTPETLYAGAGTAVFKSTDGGGTWNAARAGLTNDGVVALAIDPETSTTLYAGALGGGVFKSTDGGSTWMAVNSGLPAAPAVAALAIDPTNPTTLYAVIGAMDFGGQVVGVFKSTDSGTTWGATSLSGSGGFWRVLGLAMDPIDPTILYAATASWGFDPQGVCGGSVSKSTDGGGTWSFQPEGASPLICPAYALAVDPTPPTTLYVAAPGGVFKSTDGAGTWGLASAGLPPEPWGGPDSGSALVIDPAAPMTLYAGTYRSGVFRTTNGGGAWSSLNTGLSDWRDLRINALAIDPITPSRLYAGTDAGVFSIDQVSACVGDCAVDGQVTVNEIITMVNIALGTGSMMECGTGDGNHDNQISIDEILTAVNAALNGCPAPPMPTPRFLTEDATLYDYWPSFSPDGRSLLFSRTADGVHWELRQVPVAGGPSVSFASTPLSVSATRANWSPSGDRVAFTGVSANGLAALWLISATGTDAHRVTVGGLSGLVFYPSFYPDGNRLAITDLGAGGLNGGVVRMVDLAQATVTSLTNHSEILAGMPAVSPDGQRVAFAGQKNVGQRYDETQNSIFMLEPNGAVTQPDAGLGRAPAWSPDGEWIAFESSRASPDGRYAAFVMRTDGTRLRQLTDVSMDANHPVFSPDGKLLAFSASQSGWPITARGIAVIEVTDL